MKKYISIGIAILFTSCASTPQVSQNTVRRVSLAAELAAYTGTSLDIKAHPDHRIMYETAQIALDAMLAESNYDPVKFAEVIQQLPIKEVGTSEGALVVTSAVVIWQEYSEEVLKLDKGVYIKPIIISVNNGLKRALGK